MKQKVIAFGPLRKKIVGSWRWFGQDLADELSKYYKIIYASYGEFPKCDLIFAVKLPTFCRQALKTNRPVLLVTIDLFHSLEDIKKFTPELKQCAIVVNQCHLVWQLIPNSYYINHHIKFQTSSIYKPEGYILWVGGSQYKKIAQDYAEKHNLGPIEYIYGAKWSSENQIIWQSNAKAAFDVKESDFWQRTKPPTKIVDFIASGLPTACNENCSAREYFKEYYNFEICSPLDQTRWFSKDYFDETQEIAKVLRKDLSLEIIGLRYKNLIDSVLGITG